MSRSRLTTRRPPPAPRRVSRPLATPRSLHAQRDGAEPTEILDVVTGPYERRIVAGARRSPRR
jgi:hypothetical protein